MMPCSASLATGTGAIEAQTFVVALYLFAAAVRTPFETPPSTYRSWPDCA